MRRLLIICFAVFIAKTAYCMSALPIEKTFIQADGLEIKLKLRGDERLHGWQTPEGYITVFDDKTRNWTYAVHDKSGNLKPSGSIIGKGLPPEPPTKNILSSRSYGKTGIRKTSLPSKSSQMIVNPSGKANIAVILVNFNDTSVTYPEQDFESLLFGIGTKSMNDYFKEVSYGAFEVSSGPSGITGWYNAPKSHDYYGQNDPYGYDMYAGELVNAAAAGIDASFDFAPYDQDGDCYVDTLAVIHQGNGEETGGPATDIWSHQFDLNSAKNYYDGTGEYVTNDSASCGQIKVNRYIILPETVPAIAGGGIMGIGTFAHEFGHMLGLPDLYDIDGSSHGIGDWGLMGGGAWNGIQKAGDTPAHMTAWSKYKLGWVAPVEVTGVLYSESVPQAETSAVVYKFLSGNEYFLIENRQKTGFDAALPGSGLAIWHIDESKADPMENTDNSAECYPPLDCSFNHFRVSLVQADGKWELEKDIGNGGDPGDLYPGSANNVSFGISTMPNSKLYSGSASSVAVASISPSGPMMTARLAFRQNSSPNAVSLVYPENGKTGVGKTTVIKWKKSSDPDGDAVTYKLYVSTDQNFTNIPPISVSSVAKKSDRYPIYFSGWLAGFGAVLIGGVMSGSRRKIFLLLLAIAVIAAISCGGDSNDSTEVASEPVVTIGPDESGYQITLAPNSTYYWKVVADDGFGGLSTSITQSFTTGS